MRFIKAGIYSWQGLSAAFRHEEAFRQELLLFLVLAPVGIWLGDTGIERALMVGSLILVLIIELINSAIEAVVDRHGSEFHELSGRAKDIGSAAVMLSMINVALVWGFIIYDQWV
jgi:diacylglycerol kinase (ATP)